VDMNIYACRAGGAWGVGLACRLPSAACRNPLPLLGLRFPHGSMRERGSHGNAPGLFSVGRIWARALPHNRLMPTTPRFCYSARTKKPYPPGGG
jgi:hypothetical protein